MESLEAIAPDGFPGRRDFAGRTNEIEIDASYNDDGSVHWVIPAEVLPLSGAKNCRANKTTSWLRHEAV